MSNSGIRYINPSGPASATPPPNNTATIVLVVTVIIVLVVIIITIVVLVIRIKPKATSAINRVQQVEGQLATVNAALTKINSFLKIFG